MRQLDFEIPNDVYGTFRDALYLEDDAVYSDAEIEAMKMQRYEAWLAVVSAPSITPEEAREIGPKETVEINGETYAHLVGTPQSGAKLIQVGDYWYFKI